LLGGRFVRSTSFVVESMIAHHAKGALGWTVFVFGASVCGVVALPPHI